MPHRIKNRTGPIATLGETDSTRLPIRVDTREQHPLKFSSSYVTTIRGTVPVFDYAIEGDQERFTIERKSLSDFIQAVVLGDSWRRELVKIEKARDRLLPVIYVVEASFLDVATFDYARFRSGHVTPQFVYRRWAELTYIHNVHVVWAGSRQGVEYAICLILKRRFEDIR